MGGIGSFFSGIGKTISKLAPTALQIVGVASGNPALMAAGAALGSISSSNAENSAIDAANVQTITQTNYNNQRITWENQEAQRKIDLENKNIERNNQIEQEGRSYENNQIALNNAIAKANYALHGQQINEYNQRGRKASQLEQSSILSSLGETYGALSERERQESLQSSQQRLQRIRQGLRERSSLVTTQAESGAVGRSLSRDTIASAIWESEDVGTIDTNLQFTQSQLQRSKRGAQAQAQSALNRSVFYDETQELETPPTPLKPKIPLTPRTPDYNPMPLQGAPTLAPTLSSSDIITRAAAGAAGAFFAGQQPKAPKYKPATTGIDPLNVGGTIAGGINYGQY